MCLTINGQFSKSASDWSLHTYCSFHSGIANCRLCCLLIGHNTNIWPFPRLNGVATQTGNVVCKSKGNNHGSKIQIGFKWNYTRKNWPESQENPVTLSEEFNTGYLVNIEDESVFDRKDGFVPAEVTNEKVRLIQSSAAFKILKPQGSCVRRWFPNSSGI